MYPEVISPRQATEVNAAIASLLAVMFVTKHPYLYATAMDLCGDVLTVRLEDQAGTASTMTLVNSMIEYGNGIAISAMIGSRTTVNESRHSFQGRS